MGVTASWSEALEGKVDTGQPHKDHFREGLQRGPRSAEPGGFRMLGRYVSEGASEFC